MFYEYLVKTNKEAFLQKVKDISAKLGIDPNWLMVIMKLESGLNEKAINPNGYATGLIQFMPSTASALGTSTNGLLQMSNVDQLDYVYLYYKPFTGRMSSVYDLYLATFFPVAMGKPDNYVLQSSQLTAGQVAAANKVFDINNNGAITIGEFKQAIDKQLPNEILQYIANKATPGNLMIAIPILGIAGYFIYKQLKK